VGIAIARASASRQKFIARLKIFESKHVFMHACVNNRRAWRRNDEKSFRRTDAGTQIVCAAFLTASLLIEAALPLERHRKASMGATGAAREQAAGPGLFDRG